ncbi:unnamed protein product [Phaedon cochleariae]|uniref:Ubinuclein-1 n=1 Tax=Phaedon cochleariae TaxID=80249 RepID=A0A9P0DKD3_PHACE|nr:unnamed protein product [Phaedon cochleariae]
MSEIKRVSLTTLEPQKVSDKVNKKQFKTVRISVSLPESNEDNCPEYNYKDQLAAVKKKFKQVKDSNCVENGLDPFDNDDDVKRIALEMEAKYGTGMTGGAANVNNNNNNRRRRAKGRKDDYADIGMGYDESDSFIDNTDGYDEIIPQNVTTLHGGFYINCGALEFKTDDDASSDDASSSSSSDSSDQEEQEGEGTEEGARGGSGEEGRSKKSKKRVLDSSSSDSETASTSQVEKKPKLQTVKTTMHQAIKKKLFSSEKIQVKKKNLIDPLKKTVKDLLREKREDLDMSIPGELKEIEEHVEKDSLKENKKPMSITSVTDAIESVVKHVVEEVNYDKNQNRQNVDVNTTDLSINKSVTENPQIVLTNVESSQDVSKVQRPEVTKLPENLPSDITEIVDKIKMEGVNYKGEGKKAFFTDEVNALLLNLERKCRVLGKSSRLRVYEYLSSFVVVCKKDTLMKRARSLILDQEEKRLKKLEVELKDTIQYVMPSLTAKFEQECQIILAKKFSREGAESEELKALKMPRRKFPWTDESRKLIKDILSFKKRCLIREGKQKDKLEEQVVNYLKTVILPLWPEGWMYLNNLKKVYNSMASDNNRSANSSINTTTHSNTSKNTTIAPTMINEVKPHLQNTSADSTVHSSKPQSETTKSPPRDKPVDMFKTYTEKNSKLPEKISTHSMEPIKSESITDSSKQSKIHGENTVKAHAESLNDFSKQPKHSTGKSAGNDDLPSDLSMSSKMFKPYADNPIDKAKNTSADSERHSKPTEIYKPYVEEAMANLFGENFTASYPEKSAVKPDKGDRIASYSDKSASKSEKADRIASHPDKLAGKTDMVAPFPDITAGKSDKASYPGKSDKIASYLEKSAGKSDKASYPGKSDKIASYSDKSAVKSDKVTYPGKSERSDKIASYADKVAGKSEKADMIASHSDKSASKFDKVERTASYADKSAAKSDKAERTASYPDKYLSLPERTPSIDSKQHHRDKSKDFSQFEMFKPYADAKVNPFLNHRAKDKGKSHGEHGAASSSSSSKHKEARSDGSLKHAHRLSDIPTIFEDSTVIMKTVHQDSSTAGIDLSERSKKFRPATPDLFLPAYQPTTSTPIIPTKNVPAPNVSTKNVPAAKISKSEGDDIQMVMENLKALQKLSCSPIKNDNSSSSPVSVIAYNKSFVKSGSGGNQAVESHNSKGEEFPGGYQDEFQKQFISSLQQLQANAGASKSSYNRCS